MKPTRTAAAMATAAAAQDITKEDAAAAVVVATMAAAAVDVVAVVAVIKDGVAAEEGTTNTPLINTKDNSKAGTNSRTIIIMTKAGSSTKRRGTTRMGTPTNRPHQHHRHRRHRRDELQQRLLPVRTPILRRETTIMGVNRDVRPTETTSLRAPMNPTTTCLPSTWNQPWGCRAWTRHGWESHRGARRKFLSVTIIMA